MRDHTTVPTLASLLSSGRVSVESATATPDRAPHLTQRMANAIRAREDAWRADPRCTECGHVIASPERAGLIETTAGPRVACRRPCFSHAVARLNPTYNTAAARRREETGR